MSGCTNPTRDGTRHAFARELPEVPTQRLCGIAEAYAGIRSESRLSRKETRDQIEKIDAQIVALLASLQRADASVLEALREAEARHRSAGTRDDLLKSLAAFQEMLWMAERYSPEPKRARPAAASTWLVTELAKVVEEAGLVPDTRPTGPLCTATKIAFEHAGEARTRISVIVANALKKRD